MFLVPVFLCQQVYLCLACYSGELQHRSLGSPYRRDGYAIIRDLHAIDFILFCLLY